MLPQTTQEIVICKECACIDSKFQRLRSLYQAPAFNEEVLAAEGGRANTERQLTMSQEPFL